MRWRWLPHSRGERPPAEWEQELNQRLRRNPRNCRARADVAGALGRGVGERSPGLRGVDPLRRDGAPRDEERLLFRERVPEVGTVAWTEADLPLVDEADAILGPPAAAPAPGAGVATRPRRPGACRTVDELGVAASVSAEQVLERCWRRRCRARHRGVGRRRGACTFGHVIVDEAQDLTAMQWRMIAAAARRAP